MHSAFHAFLHHGAGRFIRLVDIAVEMVIICIATARTDEFCETVFAFLAREQTGIFELFTNIGTGDPLADATHTEFFVPCKLMARIQIAVGRNGEILVAGAARGNALGKAGAAL